MLINVAVIITTSWERCLWGSMRIIPSRALLFWSYIKVLQENKFFMFYRAFCSGISKKLPHNHWGISQLYLPWVLCNVSFTVHFYAFCNSFAQEKNEDFHQFHNNSAPHFSWLNLLYLYSHCSGVIYINFTERNLRLRSVKSSK